MGFKENIKELRLENNLSQKEMARLFHTTQSTISDWEVGRTEPNIQDLLDISKTYNVLIDELLDNDFSATKAYFELTDDKRQILLLYDSLTPKAKQEVLAFLKTLQKINREK